MPSALSRIGIGLLRTKFSVRSRAAPAFSLVCSHALLAVPDIPRLLVWKAPTSADALVGTSSLNSSPVGLIIQLRFRFSWPVRAASPIAENLTRLILAAEIVGFHFLS